MKKEDLQSILKTLQEIGKETEQLETREKEKYKVCLILKETLETLQMSISSLAQLEARGHKVRSFRRNNVRNLRISLINLYELAAILDPESRSRVEVLKSQLVDKISPKKKKKKRPGKVSA